MVGFCLFFIPNIDLDGLPNLIGLAKNRSIQKKISEIMHSVIAFSTMKTEGRIGFI